MAKIDFDYINAAQTMATKGNFESALYYYFLQRNHKYDKEIDVRIGETYLELGLYHEAIKYFMRAYAVDKHNTGAINGLINAYGEVDEEAAYFYLHHALMKEDGYDEIDFSDYDEYDDDYDDFELKLYDRHDKGELLDTAFELLENGNTEEGVKALKAIKKDDYQYCDAVLALASMEMDKRDVKAALALSDEALSVDQHSVGAHVLKIMAFDMVNDEAAKDEWAAKLNELNPKDEDDVTKTAMCFCSYGYNDYALKYLLRKIEFDPYDKLTLLCLSSVYIHSGDKENAFKTAARVSLLYPDDVGVKEISSRILSKKKVNMPGEVFELKKEWTDDIKKMFIEQPDAISTPEVKKKIKWLLSSDDDLYLQSAVCAVVAGLPEYDSLMNEILLDPFSPTIVKKQILLRKVCDDRIKQVKFVISNIFRSFKIKHPEVEANLKFAYYYVFISLAVSEYRFERKLGVEFKKLSEHFSSCGRDERAGFSVCALAAILYSGVAGCSREKSCDYFDCDEADFDSVSAALKGEY